MPIDWGCEGRSEYTVLLIELGMMVYKLVSESQLERWQFLAWATARQCGESLGVALLYDQGGEHLASTDAEEISHHTGELGSSKALDTRSFALVYELSSLQTRSGLIPSSLPLVYTAKHVGEPPISCGADVDSRSMGVIHLTMPSGLIKLVDHEAFRHQVVWDSSSSRRLASIDE